MVGAENVALAKFSSLESGVLAGFVVGCRGSLAVGCCTGMQGRGRLRLLELGSRLLALMLLLANELGVDHHLLERLGCLRANQVRC